MQAGATSRTVTETLQRDFAGAGGSDIFVAVRFSSPPADPAASLSPYLGSLRQIAEVDNVQLAGYKNGVASVVVHTHYTAQELPARDVVHGVPAIRRRVARKSRSVVRRRR